MAGYAGYGGYYGAFIVLIEAEIFLVDLCRHTEHAAGHILFRFFITGEVEVFGSAVFGAGMTKVTVDAQGCFPSIHYLIQVIVADIFGQYFQVSFRLVFRRAGCGHADHHKTDKDQCNANFFVMQHNLIIWCLNLRDRSYIILIF